MCAKSRESLDSTVEFLTLHNQLVSLKGSAELNKLHQLKVGFSAFQHFYIMLLFSKKWENCHRWTRFVIRN